LHAFSWNLVQSHVWLLRISTSSQLSPKTTPVAVDATLATTTVAAPAVAATRRPAEPTATEPATAEPSTPIVAATVGAARRSTTL
jgi:hypothetical protein